MTAGAKKPLLQLPLSPNLSASLHIATHRSNADGFGATHQITALHDPDFGRSDRRFTLARVVGNDVTPWRETAYEVARADEIAAAIRPDQRNLYVSMQSFRRWRCISDLVALGCCYVDLDYRKRVRWSESRPEDVLWAAMSLLDENDVPSPSFAVSTGNGLCLVWLHEYVPRAALPRWTAIQRTLASHLNPFGSDKNALDAARVFRVMGSRNTRARDWHHEIVKALYVQADPTKLRQYAYPFGEFADQVLPISRADLVSLRSERAKRRADRDAATQPAPATSLSAATYAEAVLTDLQRLRRHRYGDVGALPAGARDEWLFIASCVMAHLSPPSVLEREIAALAAEAAGWKERETRSRMSAVLARARAAAKGEKIKDPRGNEVDPRYRFKAATIVDRLEITSAEMGAAGLRVLVDEDRRRELNTIRKQESRHRRGAKPRQQAQTERLELGLRALYRMASQGETQSQVAKIEGVSEFQISKAIKEAREKYRM